jgi:hypothetical protein
MEERVLRDQFGTFSCLSLVSLFADGSVSKMLGDIRTNDFALQSISESGYLACHRRDVRTVGGDCLSRSVPDVLDV